MKERSLVSKVGMALLVTLLGLIPMSCGAASDGSYGFGPSLGRPNQPAVAPATAAKSASESAAAVPSPKSVDAKLLAANHQFGFKLFQAIQNQATTSPPENIFVSPSSVAIALAMSYNGANGSTRTDMAQALQLNGMSLAALNQSNEALKAALEGADPDVQLSIANSLWARKGVAFKPDFIQRNRDFYQAEVSLLDFTRQDSVGTINNWVKAKTQGKIPKVVDRLNPDDVMYLINAVYFKGGWSVPFEPKLTTQQPFRQADGTQKQHPMMIRRDRFSYSENDQFQAVNLPYGSGRWSMYVFLPRKSSNLTEFSKTLTAANWQAWMQGFKKQTGFVQLPKFKSEFDTELKSSLTALGMGDAFNPQKADFSNLLKGDKSSINQVKHKTFVEVNEQGTEAAAVTSIGITTTSIQQPTKAFEMIVDRPFFCAIRDNETGTLLFMGTIQNPEV
ncbi:serpin family protein [filamentous cyanobacterium LEGE 11480]|uniref:Serpin family protein n=1 Tax=Romeriopsis navalis LEGE 11480 TaxID=2777977 RepID=A0A928VSC6_9CYAN|nr:serpin family protein [Romeriopsis navalis]MBE9031209.1 serpin family protein [Romeriopsis navalis LEGE 11480]